MAIGSAPEIGVRFVGIDGFDWGHWCRVVGEDLMGGYGKICWPDPERMAKISQEWLDNPESGGERIL